MHLHVPTEIDHDAPGPGTAAACRRPVRIRTAARPTTSSALQEAAHRFARDVLRPAGRELDRMTAEDAIAPGSPYWAVFAEAAKLGIDAQFFAAVRAGPGRQARIADHRGDGVGRCRPRDVAGRRRLPTAHGARSRKRRTGGTVPGPDRLLAHHAARPWLGRADPRTARIGQPASRATRATSPRG